MFAVFASSKFNNFESDTIYTTISQGSGFVRAGNYTSI